MNEDQQFERMYAAQQRRTHGGRRNLPCPDCHQPNRMTAGELAKGYHCDECTRAIEGYQPPIENECGQMEY